jgi:hypothetical protein
MLPVIVLPAAIIAWRVGLFSDSNAYEVNVSDCYAVGATSLEVDCSEPHVAEVIAIWKIPDRDLPTDARIDQLASDRCPGETDLYLFPSEFTWMDGDRNSVCLKSVE